MYRGDEALHYALGPLSGEHNVIHLPLDAFSSSHPKVPGAVTGVTWSYTASNGMSFAEPIYLTWL